MQRRQAYQYELIPTGDQQRDMLRFAGACRFMFNKALALQTANHAAGNKFIGYQALRWNCLPPLNTIRRYAADLRKAQQAIAKVQRIHVRIANARRDYLHKTSTTISKSHAMVVVEDLQVKNMSRSASGIVQQPGRNVGAKAGLNRSILDQGWAEFRRQLEYKMLRAGGLFLVVTPQNTSSVSLGEFRIVQAIKPIVKENLRRTASGARLSQAFSEYSETQPTHVSRSRRS